MQKIKLFRDLEKLLYKVHSLSRAEKQAVLEELKPCLDAGGIDKFEIKNVMLKLRREHKISDADKIGIEKVLDEAMGE